MTTEADQKLSNAIDAALAEYYAAHENPTYVIDWMLITSEMDISRNNTSGIGMQYRDGQMSWVTALGLAEAARLRLQAGWMDGQVRDD